MKQFYFNKTNKNNHNKYNLINKILLQKDQLKNKK
jgi:hypothetical protein